MNQLIRIGPPSLPALVAAAGDRAASASSNSSPPQSATRTPGGSRAAAWQPVCCRSRTCKRCTSPPGLRRRRATYRPAVKQRVAAIRHLFDVLTNGQVAPINPAHTVRGSRHLVICGRRLCSIRRKRALLDLSARRREPGGRWIVI